jgi:hypothetical protein
MVTFTPLLEKDYRAVMRVLYDHGVVTSEVSLRGSGVDISRPAVTVNPSRVDFGVVATGKTHAETVVITNTGNVDVKIVGIDLPGDVFKIVGVDAGAVLQEGQSLVAVISFVPQTVGNFSAALRMLFDHDLPSQTVNFTGVGIEVEYTPQNLVFPDSDVGDDTIKEVVVVNHTDHDLQLMGAVTGEPTTFKVGGASAGDIVAAYGGSLVIQVTFAPQAPGHYTDALYFSIGPVQDLSTTPAGELDWGHSYSVSLEGNANANFTVSEYNTFTADNQYKINISASSNEQGQLFVLFSHAPLSRGKIYALTPDGELQLFPFQSVFGWQNLWYLKKTWPGNVLDLSWINLQGLGCTECPGPPEESTGDDIPFGDIIITPPSDEPYNNAADFKYLSGILYIATYVKDPLSSSGKPFDFNQGLLEIQTLHINSLAGTWQVTSEYYGEGRVNPGYLVVNEANGDISASWLPYILSGIDYGDDQAAYTLQFNVGAYLYTYVIDSLEENSFKGHYVCTLNGITIAADQKVCGVRVGSGVICPPMNDDSNDNPDDGTDEPDKHVVSFSGNGSKNTTPFTVDGPWDMYWSTDDHISVYIYRADGSLADIVSSDAGDGSSYQPNAGEYHLSIVTSGNWSVEIQHHE